MGVVKDLFVNRGEKFRNGFIRTTEYVKCYRKRDDTFDRKQVTAAIKAESSRAFNVELYGFLILNQGLLGCGLFDASLASFWPLGSFWTILTYLIFKLWGSHFPMHIKMVTAFTIWCVKTWMIHLIGSKRIIWKIYW